MAVFNRYIRAAAPLWLLLLVTVHATAQRNGGFSLLQLVDTATHYLPSLLQKQALVSSARANVTDARHTALPSLRVSDQLNISSANSLDGTYLPLGGTVSTSGAIRSSNVYQPATANIGMLYGEYELVNFGLRKARVNNALSNVSLSSSDYERELYLTKLRISQLYFTMLRNQFQLDIDAQNISRYRSIYTVIKAITQSGIRAGVDSSLAKAELSKAQISYNEVAGQITQLRQQMAMLTGIQADSLLIDTAYLQYAPGEKTGWDLSGVDTARNPLVDYYRKQRDLYTSTANLIKKSYLPKIMLAGGFWGRGSSIDYTDQYKALSTGLGFQRFNYAAGIAFVYNLFDGVHRKDKLAVNKYNMQASDYALQQQELALNTALQQAQTAINIAEKNLQELPVQLQAAKDAFEQKTAQYKAGVINLVDLTNASFVLYRAQIDYVQTMNDWLQANLNKAAALGNLDQFIQSVKN
jgi:outer membrane protein TolC